jgi:hypothetical protein
MKRRYFLLLSATLLASLTVVVPASAQIAIGFCQGQGGTFESFSASFLVCCPGDPAPTPVTAVTAPVDCGDASAVMAAMNAAIGALTWGGSPIFGAPIPSPSPIPGQARFEYPLSPAFLAMGCCIVGGSVDFECGTMSLRINPPCSKGGDPRDRRPVKLCVDGPPPGPSTLNLILEGCLLVAVMLDGDETAAEVRAELLAALLGAGYSAFINADDKVEITEDCTGELPLGVDEFGLTGGLPMPQGIVVCPPPDDPVPWQPASWGMLKGRFRAPPE